MHYSEYESSATFHDWIDRQRAKWFEQLAQSVSEALAKVGVVVEDTEVDYEEANVYIVDQGHSFRVRCTYDSSDSVLRTRMYEPVSDGTLKCCGVLEVRDDIPTSVAIEYILHLMKCCTDSRDAEPETWIEENDFEVIPDKFCPWVGGSKAYLLGPEREKREEGREHEWLVKIYWPEAV